MKKLISLLLTVIMVATTVLSAIPVGAENTGATVETDTNNLTVEGTNGFGDLLSEDILDSQEESEEHEEGYTVTDLVIEGNVATVTYDSLEAANLVVALYTEDMVQMICSANTVVDPESTTATVTLEGEMPQYFMAAAYLVDIYDMSPLCPVYDTPLYTKDMQDLLNSTVNDYDEELVFNLDDNEETNFAVYNEETIVIEGDADTNIVASVDDEALTYVIENADDTMKNLTIGTVFVYPYEENQMLIAKVGSIDVSGDTVTVTGTDLEMEDVFSHVKIDGESYTADVEVDTSTADEGVTYNGLVSDGPVARSWEGGGDAEVYLSFEFEHKMETDGDHVDLSFGIEGALDFKLSASISYYISLSKQYIEVTVTPTATARIAVTGSVDCKLPLGFLGFAPVPGVYIGFEPDLVFSVEGTIETNITFTSTFGVGYYSDTGIKNLSKAPTVEVNLKAEVTIFFGIDFNPKITIVSDKIARLELNMPVGVELKAEGQGKIYGAAATYVDSRHGCNACIKLDLKFKAEISGKITLLGLDWLTVSVEIGRFTLPVGDMYWSEDMGKFGFGTCPNEEYKVTVTALDDDKKACKGVAVTISDGQSEVTNKNGSAVFYLTEGSYTVSADFGDKMAEKEFKVKDESKKVKIYENDSLNPSEDKSKNDTNKVQSGAQTGDDYMEGSKVPEKLYYSTYNGEVTITGYGGNDPNLKIPSKIGGYPVRNIAVGAFDYSTNLVSIILPEGLTTIGASAFYYCTNLVRVTLPESLTTIGYRAFGDCSNLKSINVPDSVTSIGDSAFYQCYSLESINIPAGITSIGEAVYERCGSLKNVIIPDSVTSIGPAAFYYCLGLTSITIPANVESIGSSAFHYCENLRSITFTGDAPSINNTAFGTSWGYGAIISDLYYPANNPTWTSDVLQNYGGKVTWIAYSGAAPASMDNDITIMSGDINDGLDLMSVYPGEYGTETTPEYELKTAFFNGLVAGEEYLLLVLKDMGAADTLSSGNLLYIAQGTALEDGTLTFKYVPKVSTDYSYVIACGPSNKNLCDAEIIFPEMEADGELNTVEPTVVYDGVTLTEGVDYVIVGTVSYRVRGTYTCYIRGIYDYTGTVKCTYTVEGDFLPGDIDSDGRLTAMDSNLLKRIVAGTVSADGIIAADVNGDGAVNAIDSNILRRTIAGQ